MDFHASEQANSYLGQNGFFQWHHFTFLRVDFQNFIVDFIVECDQFGVVEHAQQMILKSMEHITVLTEVPLAQRTWMVCESLA